MPQVFQALFEGTAGTSVTAANSGFTSVSAGAAATLTYRAGGYSGNYMEDQINATSTSSTLSKTISPAVTTLAGRMRFRVSAFGANTQIMSCRVGTVNCLVRITSTGKVQLHNSTTAVATTALSHVLNDWVLIEFVFTAGRIQLTLTNPDGSNETISGVAGNGACDQWRCGILGASTNYRCDFDDASLDTGTSFAESDGANLAFTTVRPILRTFAVSNGYGASFVMRKGVARSVGVSNGWGESFAAAPRAVSRDVGTITNGVNLAFTVRHGASRTFAESDGWRATMSTSRSAARQFNVSNGAGFAFTTRHGGTRTFTVREGAGLTFTKRHGGARSFVVSNGDRASFTARRGSLRSFALSNGVNIASVVVVRPHVVSFTLSNGVTLSFVAAVGGHGYYDDEFHIGPPEGRSPRVSLAKYIEAGPPSIGSLSASL